MKVIKTECTSCGAKLDKVDEKTMRCSFCGMTYLLEDVEPPQETKGKKAAMPEKSRTVEPQKVKHENGIKWMAIMTFSFLAFLIIVAVVQCVKESLDDHANETKEIEIIVVEEVSEEFQAFARELFGKDYEALTAEDWNGVTTLSIQGVSGEYEINATIKDQDVHFFYQGNLSKIIDAIGKFAALQKLELNSTVNQGDLDELTQLTELSCTNTMSELAKILPAPENITSLTNVYIRDTTEGIEKFSNLQTLAVRVRNVTDLSALATLKNLEDIDIYSLDDLKNFDMLGELVNLKRVCIDSDGLYSLEFVRNLKQLEALEVERSAITSLAPIEGNTKIHTLLVDGCDEIEDFEVINTLTNLQVLSVPGDEIQDKIQWESLTNLRYLFIESYLQSNLMQELPKLSWLEGLHLGWCGQDLTPVGELTNLKYLSIEQMSENLFMLKNLTNLEKIVLTNVRGVQGAEYIFSSPKLKEVVLFDCRLIVDFDEVAKNESLEKLDIQYCSFQDIIVEEDKDYYYYGEYEAVDLADRIAVIEGFTSLKELTIRGAKLENIDFVNSLLCLQKLDVTNNNIADVSLLDKHPSVNELWCGDNALLAAPTFKRDIKVDMRGETNILYQ